MRISLTREQYDADIYGSLMAMFDEPTAAEATLRQYPKTAAAVALELRYRGIDFEPKADTYTREAVDELADELEAQRRYTSEAMAARDLGMTLQEYRDTLGLNR